ncbi:unnamed protein product [Rotaria sp. Silwood2]|nr:unnamed protein product [Rotaria sp. Silwood2]CAF4355567.1 unnamed protein product [Rotaria sp. Silwood2]
MATETRRSSDSEDDNISDHDQWLKSAKDYSTLYNYDNNLSDSEGYPFRKVFSREIFEENYKNGNYFAVEYPIWQYYQVCGKKSATIRYELLRKFNKLNKERQDFHDYPSPVEDIIDPDLLVYKPHGIIQNSNGYYEASESQSQPRYHSEKLPLRSTYQWIPSDFRICSSASNVNGLVEYKVHIETPISHLPMNEEYEQTYRNLEKIFEKIVPMFKKLNVLNSGNVDTRLQVIVKVQSYNIKPGIKYSGRWHTEGYEEGIVAVGVYYVHIDDKLEGGALKFRPAKLPYANYGGEGKPELLDDGPGYYRSVIEKREPRHLRSHFYEDVNRYVIPQTDTAIVFSNSLPHRFCSIRNRTQRSRRRTFLNFFIVDPCQPILRSPELEISNLILVSYEACYKLLRKTCVLNNAKSECKQELPDVVIEKILTLLSLIQNLWPTDVDSKEFRRCVRCEMCKQKPSWKGISFGNWGYIDFIVYQKHTYGSESEHLFTTSTDTNNTTGTDSN